MPVEMLTINDDLSIRGSNSENSINQNTTNDERNMGGMGFLGYTETALCTHNPTSRTQSSSSAPSHSALSASAKTRAQADFFRPFKVGWKMTKSCSWEH